MANVNSSLKDSLIFKAAEILLSSSLNICRQSLAYRFCKAVLSFFINAQKHFDILFATIARFWKESALIKFLSSRLDRWSGSRE